MFYILFMFWCFILHLGQLFQSKLNHSINLEPWFQTFLIQCDIFSWSLGSPAVLYQQKDPRGASICSVLCVSYNNAVLQMTSDYISNSDQKAKSFQNRCIKSKSQDRITTSRPILLYIALTCKTTKILHSTVTSDTGHTIVVWTSVAESDISYLWRQPWQIMVRPVYCDFYIYLS